MDRKHGLTERILPFCKAVQLLPVLFWATLFWATVQAPLNGYGIRPLKSLRDEADACFHDVFVRSAR